MVSRRNRRRRATHRHRHFAPSGMTAWSRRQVPNEAATVPGRRRRRMRSLRIDVPAGLRSHRSGRLRSVSALSRVPTGAPPTASRSLRHRCPVPRERMLVQPSVPPGLTPGTPGSSIIVPRASKTRPGSPRLCTGDPLRTVRVPPDALRASRSRVRARTNGVPATTSRVRVTTSHSGFPRHGSRCLRLSPG